MTTLPPTIANFNFLLQPQSTGSGTKTDYTSDQIKSAASKSSLLHVPPTLASVVPLDGDSSPATAPVQPDSYRFFSCQTIQLLLNLAVIGALAFLLLTSKPFDNTASQIVTMQEQLELLISASTNQQNTAQLTTATSLNQLQGLLQTLTSSADQQNSTQATAALTLTQQQQQLQDLQIRLQSLLGSISSQNASQTTALRELLQLQSSVQQSFSVLQSAIVAQSANFSDSVSVHASKLSQLNQLSLQTQNTSLSTAFIQLNAANNQFQSLIQQAQANVASLNSILNSVLSAAVPYASYYSPKYAASCQSNFLPANMRSESLGQGCYWHSGSTTFDLLNSSYYNSSVVNQPNLTFSFTCVSMNPRSGNPVTMSVSIATPDANWFSVSADCTGVPRVYTLLYSRQMVFPAKATAAIYWGWCGLDDSTVIVTSMCVRADWS
jgi:hypothetical protein